MSENSYQKRIQAAAARAGVCLYRNNVGQARDAVTGRVIRFGLCKGSSDLIGWTPVQITPEMVGQTVAVFTAVECKGERTRITPEQVNWLRAVKRDGGIALVKREPEDWT